MFLFLKIIIFYKKDSILEDFILREDGRFCNMSYAYFLIFF